MNANPSTQHARPAGPRHDAQGDVAVPARLLALLEAFLRALLSPASPGQRHAPCWHPAAQAQAARLLPLLLAALAREAKADAARSRAPIPRPLRRGSPDIIIALAHGFPPRPRALPARFRPAPPSHAHDPPPRRRIPTAAQNGPPRRRSRAPLLIAITK